MTPIFGRKKDPKEVFDENMKKAKKLWESPKLWKSSRIIVHTMNLLKLIGKAQEIAKTVEVDQEDLVHLWSMKGDGFLILYPMFHDRLDIALECFDKALSINPRHRRSLTKILLVLQEMEKWDELIENCDNFFESIQEFCAETPEFRVETPEEMLISMRTPLLSLPFSRDRREGIDRWTWDMEESRIWALRGYALVHLERVREALSCCDKALELNPRNVNAWIVEALCYELLEKWQEAIYSCDKAIELDLKNTAAWRRKGGAISRSGRHEEALTCYDRALEINPKDWASLNEKGLALYHLGRYEEALECIDKSLEYGPKWYERSELDAWPTFPRDVRTLLNKARVLGTLAGGDLYELSKRSPEEWAQKKRKVEKMHFELEKSLAWAIDSDTRAFVNKFHVGMHAVEKDWESLGGPKVSWRGCNICKEGGLVEVAPLFIARKKRWGYFVGALCPHTRAMMPLIKGKMRAKSTTVLGYTPSSEE